MTRFFRELKLALFIAIRILRSQRTPTLSLVTFISIAATAVGVMSLTVVLGVTDGFKTAFRDRILGLYPHVVVHRNTNNFSDYKEALSQIRSVEGVVGASPVTFDDVMVSAGTKRSGAIIKGVELSSVDGVLSLGSLLKDGATLDALKETPHIKRTSSELLVTQPTAGTRLTLVETKSGIRALVDERAVPAEGHCRVVSLDVRGEAKGLSLIANPASEADDNPPIELPDSRPGRFAASQNVPKGEWVVSPTGTRLTCGEERMITLVLRPGKDAMHPNVEIVETMARLKPELRYALVRVVRAHAEKSNPIDLKDERGLLLQKLPQGATSAYVPVPGQLPGIFLGSDLATRLATKLGDEVTLVTPLRGIDNQMLGPVGMLPTSTLYRVAGVFESGFHDYDKRLAFVNIDSAQRFINRGDVIRWIEVRSQDILGLDDLKRRIKARVDPYDLNMMTTSAIGLEAHIDSLPAESLPGFLGRMVSDLNALRLMKTQEHNMGHSPQHVLIDWKEMNTHLFRALKLQQVILTLFFGIIIIVASFVVVGSQIMVIHDKTADIAILQAIGSNRRQIHTVFTLQGLIVAGIGVVAGLILGVGCCALISWVDYKLDASIYLIDRLPASINPMELVFISAATLLCMFVAVQYSAGRAASRTPVEGLRSLD